MEKKEILMALLIGVILLSTAMQTFALVNLNNGQTGITGNAVASSPGPSSNAASTGHSGAGSGTSLDNLPSMVGGC